MFALLIVPPQRPKYSVKVANVKRDMIKMVQQRTQQLLRVGSAMAQAILATL